MNDDEFLEKMEAQGDEFQDMRDKTIYYQTLARWKKEGQRNPFDIVKEFIQEKGIKIYGGLALNEYIRQYEKPFYGEEEFPDYDVYSPNAWQHAQQLAKRLYDEGFKYTEARSSILNDKQHQTYKVSADFDYVMDITQVGCLPKQIRENRCSECGIQTVSGDCIDLFNNVPVYPIDEIKALSKGKDVQMVRQTYDMDKDQALFPDKIWVVSPQFLKVSAYRETTEPITHPHRLSKVSTRLRKLDRYYEWSERRCSLKRYNKAVNKHLQPVLKEVGEMCQKKQWVHYGATAHNLFVKNNKKYKSRHYGSLVVADYNVYSEHAEKDRNALVKHLKKKFPAMVFDVQEKREFWKEADSDSYLILVSVPGTEIKRDTLIQMTQPVTCIPYVQYRGVRYVAVDRLKYIYYRGAVIPRVMEHIEQNQKNYGCLLSHLLASEKAYLSTKFTKGVKFRRYIGKCYGEEINKMRKSLIRRWNERHERKKGSKVRYNYPKKGYATRIHPMPEEDVVMPYKPMDHEFAQREHRIELKDPYTEPKIIQDNKEIDDVSDDEKSYSTYRRFWSEV